MIRREMKYGNERRFCDNIIYDGSTISQILVDGGYITLNDNGSPIYHFYVTDHQGNNRLVVDANGNVEERNDYYPYGALMSSSTTSIQRYKYNGKELNQHSYMLWYDYMARQTMPILGRFSSVDPLCEKYYSMSPYLYCAGNPMNCVDSDGKTVNFIGENYSPLIGYLNVDAEGILSFSVNDNGQLLCQKADDKIQLEGKWLEIYNAIHDENVVVNLVCTSQNYIRMGDKIHPFCGGAFGGSRNELQEDFKQKAIATQYINVPDMRKICGTMQNSNAILHEVSEAYQGGLVGLSAIGVPNSLENKYWYQLIHGSYTNPKQDFNITIDRNTNGSKSYKIINAKNEVTIIKTIQ